MLLRNLPAFCFHSSATIKTCKRSIFHSYKPQRWRQVNQSQFIDGETSVAFSNASSVLQMQDKSYRRNDGTWKQV